MSTSVCIYGVLKTHKTSFYGVIFGSLKKNSAYQNNFKQLGSPQTNKGACRFDYKVIKVMQSDIAVWLCNNNNITK